MKKSPQYNQHTKLRQSGKANLKQFKLLNEEVSYMQQYLYKSIYTHDLLNRPVHEEILLLANS